MNTKKMINILTVAISIVLLSACGASFNKQTNSLDDKTNFTSYQTEATQYPSSNNSSIDTPEKKEETQDQSTSQVNKVPNQNITPQQTELLTQKNKLGKLTISSDKHMLQYEGGQGFFWMGDTAWNLAYKLTKNEIVRYLNNRNEKGFNVIQMAAVRSKYFTKNTDNEKPFNNNYSSPNKKYWENVDFIIDEAAKRGMFIALLPSWNNVLINITDAEIYGKFIAKRYKNKQNIIWVIGGDSLPDKKDFTPKAIWNALGNTINSIDNNHLITFHPGSGILPSVIFNKTDWLDFNMIQTGHCATIEQANISLYNNYQNSNMPILDGEPRYEDIEECFYKENPGERFRDKDVREIAYRQVFKGALGHTYGHHSVWKMHKNGDNDTEAGLATKTWEDALNDSGASQMGYLAKLMKSRPILGRIPKQSIIQGGNGIATQGKGYAMVYLPKGGSITVNLNEISNSVKAWWYNPQTGDATLIDTYKTATQMFTTGKDDMVLVLDDKSKNFATPGQ